MKSYKIAWRNLWRNRRRTYITVASVFFAVFFSLIMRSLQLGTYDHMFRNAIESYTGYIQVQHEDFWDDKTVDNAFSFTSGLEQKISAIENVTGTVPRFESFALASSGSLTKGVLVMGIDPEKEALLSDVRKRLVRYRLTDANIEKLSKTDLPEKLRDNLELFKGNSYANDFALSVDLDIDDADSAAVLPLFRKYAKFENGYIRKGEPGALIGDKLASFLHAGVGDTIVLLGQ